MTRKGFSNELFTTEIDYDKSILINIKEVDAWGLRENKFQVDWPHAISEDMLVSVPLYLELSVTFPECWNSVPAPRIFL